MTGSDVIFKPVASNPIQEGWVMAYVDQLGNTKTLAPTPNRGASHPNGQLPILINHSGLVTRFDDTSYYTT